MNYYVQNQGSTLTLGTSRNVYIGKQGTIEAYKTNLSWSIIIYFVKPFKWYWYNLCLEDKSVNLQLSPFSLSTYDVIVTWYKPLTNDWSTALCLVSDISSFAVTVTTVLITLVELLNSISEPWYHRKQGFCLILGSVQPNSRTESSWSFHISKI